MSRLSLRHLRMGCGESLQARRCAGYRKERQAETAPHGGNDWPRALKAPAAKDKQA